MKRPNKSHYMDLNNIDHMNYRLYTRALEKYINYLEKNHGKNQ